MNAGKMMVATALSIAITAGAGVVAQSAKAPPTEGQKGSQTMSMADMTKQCREHCTKASKSVDETMKIERRPAIQRRQQDAHRHRPDAEADAQYERPDGHVHEHDGHDADNARDDEEVIASCASPTTADQGSAGSDLCTPAR